jgi:hypothetical protein
VKLWIRLEAQAEALSAIGSFGAVKGVEESVWQRLDKRKEPFLFFFLVIALALLFDGIGGQVVETLIVGGTLGVGELTSIESDQSSDDALFRFHHVFDLGPGFGFLGKPIHPEVCRMEVLLNLIGDRLSDELKWFRVLCTQASGDEQKRHYRGEVRLSHSQYENLTQLDESCWRAVARKVNRNGRLRAAPYFYKAR